MEYIGSSVNIRWRAKQLKEACDAVTGRKAEENSETLGDGANVRSSALSIQMLYDLAEKTHEFCGAIREFGSETHTKDIEHALNQFAAVLRSSLLQSVSTSRDVREGD